MEPIVNPWFIYWLGVIEGLKTLNIVILALVNIGLFFVIIFYIFDELTPDDWKTFKLWLRLSIGILILTILVAVFVPSRNTLIAMYIADNITSDNVEKALKVGKDFKEEIKKDIFELIEAIQKDENKSNE